MALRIEPSKCCVGNGGELGELPKTIEFGDLF